MAVDWLVPASDGTVGTWTTTTLWPKVDDYSTLDGSITDDAQEIVSPSKANSSCFVGLTATSVGFVPTSVTKIQVQIRKSEVHTGVAGSQDRSELFVQVFRSDESTAISTEVQVGAGTQTEQLVTLTLSGSHTKAQWDGARLRLRHLYTQQGGPDTVAQTKVQAVAVAVTWAGRWVGFLKMRQRKPQRLWARQRRR